MPYASLDDLKKRLPEDKLIALTDDADTGDIDENVIAEICSGIDDIIDGKLRGIYALPLADVPGIIKAIAIDGYIYELYGRKPEFGIPDSVDKKWANAQKLLEQIRTGAIQLGVAGVKTPAAETPVDGLQVATGDRIFTDSVLSRY